MYVDVVVGREVKLGSGSGSGQAACAADIRRVAADVAAVVVSSLLLMRLLLFFFLSSVLVFSLHPIFVSDLFELPKPCRLPCRVVSIRSMSMCGSGRERTGS